LGQINVSGVEYALSDGRVLLSDVSFRVGDGAKVALIGANGSGKTTLFRMIAGDLEPDNGSIIVTGGLGVMRQFIGSIRDESTVRDLLVSISSPKIRNAATKLSEAEKALAQSDTEKEQMAYAQALSDWGDAGGYEEEVLWDIANREVNSLSGGEQKKLVLQALLNGGDEVLILDEPDNYLDVPAKRWLEEEIRNSKKTILFISHDRELLAATANKVVTLEQGVNGNSTWIHGEGFATYYDARKARNEQFAQLVERWDDEHKRLKELVLTLQWQAASSPDMASRYRAMQTRLRKFEELGPPPPPPIEQQVKVNLRSTRTGERVVTCEKLTLENLTEPFDFEIYYQDRVAILGKNGTGKSHFLRRLSGDESVRYTGLFKLGARVKPGFFAQTHAHPEFEGKSLLEILWEQNSLQLGAAKSVLGRYELADQAEQKFSTLSGGQQARFQVLLLELAGDTLLLLDEPTDNLDLASAEALERALDSYQGTVIAVTHDRWFARGFTRFLIFGAEGQVYESPDPVWSH
jgi:ATPase subunit of ABC transporter with duplicated ATPase domains